MPPLLAQIRAILRTAHVGPGPRLLWAYLLDRQGNNSAAWPTEATIGRDLGRSSRQIRRWLGELVTAGVVQVEAAQLAGAQRQTYRVQAPTIHRAPPRGADPLTDRPDLLTDQGLVTHSPRTELTAKGGQKWPRQYIDEANH